MKTYAIHIEQDPHYGLWSALIKIGKHEAELGRYVSRRSSRKAVKDFIKQLKEAEAESESLQTREECEKQGIKFATDEDLREI